MVGESSDVAVVGAGAFGAWTALALVEAGVSVTLFDMYAPGNDRSSSGGESRNIRAAYADDAFYTGWARRAWSAWLEREREFGTRLVFPSGSLRAASASEVEAQAQHFTACGAPFEILTPDEVHYRWPQVSWSEPTTFYEPESGALLAAGALREVVHAFCARGGKLRRAHVTAAGEDGDLTILADGSTVSSGTIVLACGPWLPRLLPALLGSLIRTPRRELLFVAPAPGDDRFSWERCPNLVGPLGWTTSDIGNGVKIAPPMRGIDMDPDDAQRLPTPIAVEATSRFVRAHLPSLADRPVISAYVSQLENTASEDFIVDRHPGAEQVIIAGGGSGHAFKFGPILGDYIARLVLESSRGEHVDRFGLGAHRPLREGEGA